MPMSVAAVIVAAGSSSRLGQPKQLLLHEGEPLLQRAIRMASEAGASPVFVVLGAHRELIEERILFGSARIVVNPEWVEGLASSIRAGVLALKSEATSVGGVLLMICDQPRLTAPHLQALMRQFDASGRQAAVASLYAGKRAIPAIFPVSAFPSLVALQGDRGASGLLKQERWPVIEVPFEGGEIDIDRPGDLANLTDNPT